MADWDDLVYRHGPLLYRAAYRVLRDAHEAEDVTQDVLLDVARAGPRAPTDPALLVCMATRRAIDRLRRRRRLAPAEGLEVAAADAGPEELAIAGELAERLDQAIARLPPRQAEVFCLRYLHDLSYEEMARTLGLGRDAVAVALHEARRRLRAWLGQTAEEPRL